MTTTRNLIPTSEVVSVEPNNDPRTDWSVAMWTLDGTRIDVFTGTRQRCNGTAALISDVLATYPQLFAADGYGSE